MNKTSDIGRTTQHRKSGKKMKIKKKKMTERLKCCEAVGAAGKGESQLSRVLLF
jgi:hypothetical protein